MTSKYLFNLMLIVFMLTMSSTSLFAQSSVQEKSLFNGSTLSGWKVLNPLDQSLWKVVDGVIVGGDGVNRVKSNSYLYTEEVYGDFEFRCLFRLSGDPTTGMINSGIQYRSTIDNGSMVGYQADIGNGYWGDIYDEHRRGKLVGGDLSTLKHLLKEDGWNSYIVRVKGNHHELYINGVKTCDYIERDPKVPSKGVIAIQLHDGGVARVELKNLTISEINP